MTTTAPTVDLVHGARMPVLGLGTSPMNDADTAAAVRTALQTGYRLIDTAENYRNEVGVGQGIKDAAVARDELFITSKFNREWHSVDGVRKAFDNSIAKIGVDYLDLLLIHWPNPDQDRYVDAWKGLVKLLEDGAVKAIGTSNFKPAHLDRIIDATGVVPDVNQINLNPYTTRDATVAYDREHKIITEAWSPLKPADILSEPVITALAAQYQRSPGQIVLRWHTQLGLVTVPKSSSPERLRDNISIFDFELTDQELASISALDKGEDHIADSDKTGH
ncbi:aldo/keto reductase [Microlunatus soli]|uniref:2,5-diketo-D-gluconate reductase A n=1 Tax=Microlunatus soli TaxID=630515 RepID=A0A1H1SGM8_9ACTN|nr:aldo/keto reductase [Microlunatus soli]SDS47081.1 2,5-diketo-D-gluconate reductase A [Microlunatus soli]